MYIRFATLVLCGACLPDSHLDAPVTAPPAQSEKQYMMEELMRLGAATKQTEASHVKARMEAAQHAAEVGPWVVCMTGRVWGHFKMV